MLKSTMKNLSETQTFMFVVMLSRSVVIGTLGSSPGAVQGTISQFQQSLQKDIATWWSEWASMWLYGNSAKGYLDPVVQYETLASVLKSVGASIFYLSPKPRYRLSKIPTELRPAQYLSPLSAIEVYRFLLLAAKLLMRSIRVVERT